MALTYYGERHGDGEQGDQQAGRHEGHEAARAAGAALPDVHASVGANATPIAFAEVYLALQQDGRRAGEPAADHHGEEVLRGADPYHADRPHHRVAPHRSSAARSGPSSTTPRGRSSRTCCQAARARPTRSAPEQKLADEFRKLGKTVVTPDRAAFRAAAMPLHNDTAAGAGWSKARIRRAAGAEVGSDRHPASRASCPQRGWAFGRTRVAACQRDARPSVRRRPPHGRGRRAGACIRSDTANRLTAKNTSSTSKTRRSRSSITPRTGWRSLIFWALAFHRLPAILHPLRAQRQPRLDRGDRALRPDVGHLHRRRGGDAQELAYRGRAGVERDEAALREPRCSQRSISSSSDSSVCSPTSR